MVLYNILRSMQVTRCKCIEVWISYRSVYSNTDFNDNSRKLDGLSDFVELCGSLSVLFILLR